jgi:hypothetical protein
MLEIASGCVRAYYLFDVADTIDLTNAGGLGARSRGASQLPLGSPISPAYLQFPVPPVIEALPNATIADLACTVRLKAYDYGVMSLRLTFDARGTWEALTVVADRVRADERIAAFAQATVERFCDERARALRARHPALIEDYFIIEIERFAENVDAKTLLDKNAAALASLMHGERRPLSAGEAEEALRTRFSYYEDDLTIVQWDTAFVYDRAESADAIEDILEFANTQLLELRTYDALLDRELDGIYKIGSEKPARSPLGRRESEQAESLRYLIVDVLELLDRSSNALKDRRRRLLRAHLPFGGQTSRLGGLAAANRCQTRIDRRHLPIPQRSGPQPPRPVPRSHHHRAGRNRSAYRHRDARPFATIARLW